MEPITGQHTTARSQRGDGLADYRRQYLRQGAALRRADPASACARGRDSDFEEQAGGKSHRAGAAAHEGAAEVVWMA